MSHRITKQLIAAPMPEDFASLQSLAFELQEDLGLRFSGNQLMVEELKRRMEGEHILKKENVELKLEKEKLEAQKEKLEAQVAKFQRMVFGQSSEKSGKPSEEPEIDTEPGIDASNENKTPENSELKSVCASGKPPATLRPPGKKPVREPLSADLPRDTIVCAAPCACKACGSQNLKPMPSGIREVLHHVREHWRVKQFILHKMSCKDCEAITETPVPSLPIPKGKATADTLAKVLTDKFCDHLPLYRQSGIYARQGLKISTSTLSGWVLACSSILTRIADAIFRYIRSGTIFYADDTPLPVLDPGRGKTKTGREWTVVRDERPFGSDAPPAVYYYYSPDRKSEHPQLLFKDCRGYLHADRYPGFGELYKVDPITGEAEIEEVGCWAHARRKFVDVYKSTKSSAADSFIEQIDKLFAIERSIKGQPPDRRKRAREEHSVLLLNALKTQMQDTYKQVSEKSELAKAMRYTLMCWPSFTRYTEDGRLEMSNNAAERAMRIVALGRKNYMFAGSDKGGEATAVLYTLIETAKMNGIDPYVYLRDVLTAMAKKRSISRDDELLPWNLYRNKASQAVTLH